MAISATLRRGTFSHAGSYKAFAQKADDGDNLVVTIELFRGALKKTMGKKMDEAEIDRIAEFVMGLFGFDMSVIDNMLSTSDRDVFYMLEEARLLRTTRDEVTIAKGKIWRIHYWILNEEKIIELNEPDPPVVKKKRGEFDIYKELDDEDWRR